MDVASSPQLYVAVRVCVCFSHVTQHNTARMAGRSRCFEVLGNTRYRLGCVRGTVPRELAPGRRRSLVAERQS